MLTAVQLQVFNYARGQHNVVQVAKPDCTFANATQVAGLTDTPFNLTLKHPGTFYYACSVSGHCDAGMLLTVHVSDAVLEAATQPPPPPAGSGVQIKQPSTAGQSRCAPPVLVLGTNDTFQVSCLSPGVPLSPGQVANRYYTLANPYPSKIVAIVQEKSQIVDGTGRAVPLSEAYAHHFFGNARFVVAEGAELRGTEVKQPLPQPYFQLVNGTFFNDPANRRMNIHLINTLGVGPADIAKCIECWCDTIAAFQQKYHGGSVCCSAHDCPTPRAKEPPTVYYLQYNVSYRDPKQIPDLIQASPVLLDVANGSIEYDVFEEGPGSVDTKTLTAPFDQHCPQVFPFGLLRCTGHQHIGGICMEIVDTEAGHVICTSCSVYGNSTSADTPGQEKGYLVEMTDDTLVPPYPLKPGQNVTIVSKYNADKNHFGVMALWILTVTNWDPTCPGGAPATNTLAGSLDVYTTFAGPAGGAVPNATTY
ncbi:hypothetical protein COCOBI_17-0080 [Coccomyxa sp. Obi]|nr:hypothetical protein COCOBI_17-0080 [Coccomyxa sp. Obi]